MKVKNDKNLTAEIQKRKKELEAKKKKEGGRK